MFNYSSLNGFNCLFDNWTAVFIQSKDGKVFGQVFIGINGWYLRNMLYVSLMKKDILRVI